MILFDLLVNNLYRDVAVYFFFFFLFITSFALSHLILHSLLI